MCLDDSCPLPGCAVAACYRCRCFFGQSTGTQRPRAFFGVEGASEWIVNNHQNVAERESVFASGTIPKTCHMKVSERELDAVAGCNGTQTLKGEREKRKEGERLQF